MKVYGFWDRGSCETEYYLNKDSAKVAAIKFMCQELDHKDLIKKIFQLITEDKVETDDEGIVCCIEEVDVME